MKRQNYMITTYLLKNKKNIIKKIIFKILFVIFLIQTNFLFNCYSVSIESLTEDEKSLIITTIKKLDFKLVPILKNVEDDHMEGSSKNLSKSYFFKNSNSIKGLLLEVCNNPDKCTVNAARATLILVKYFPDDIGMAVYENPKGISHLLPNGTSPAGTKSSQIINTASFPMVEVPSKRVALVIGLKKIAEAPTLDPKQANFLTFYPQKP